MNHFSVASGGPVARITLTRPEHGNRLDIETIKALTAALAAAAASPDVKVIHLRGEGKDFCLGRQLPPVEPGAVPVRKSAIQMQQQLTDPILALYAAIRNAPVPVVATVTGGAHGLGCALAVQCDVTIAADNARFSLPEMRSDLPPTLAISAVLRAIPAKALAHLVYSAEEISAADALRLGLLSATFPPADFDAEVERYLDNMAVRARAALGAVKEYLNLAPYQDPHGAARYGANLLSAVLSSQ
jgi:enoyl-CoA hydratase